MLQKKTVNTQEHTSRIYNNSYDSAYSTLQCKLKKVTRKVKLTRLLVSDLLKALNNLNPIYVNELFQKSKFLTYRPSSIEVNACSISKYGTKVLSQLGSNIWNSFPEEA